LAPAATTSIRCVNNCLGSGIWCLETPCIGSFGAAHRCSRLAAALQDLEVFYYVEHAGGGWSRPKRAHPDPPHDLAGRGLLADARLPALLALASFALVRIDTARRLPLCLLFRGASRCVGLSAPPPLALRRLPGLYRAGARCRSRARANRSIGHGSATFSLAATHPDGDPDQLHILWARTVLVYEGTHFCVFPSRVLRSVKRCGRVACCGPSVVGWGCARMQARLGRMRPRPGWRAIAGTAGAVLPEGRMQAVCACAAAANHCF
jgi:hypothetical protein